MILDLGIQYSSLTPTCCLMANRDASEPDRYRRTASGEESLLGTGLTVSLEYWRFP